MDLMTFETLIQTPVNTKINSVLFGLNDNHNGQFNGPYEDRVHKEICYFLSCVAEKHNIHQLNTFFDIGSLNGAEGILVSQLLPQCKVCKCFLKPKQKLKFSSCPLEKW